MTTPTAVSFYKSFNINAMISSNSHPTWCMSIKPNLLRFDRRDSNNVYLDKTAWMLSCYLGLHCSQIMSEIVKSITNKYCLTLSHIMIDAFWNLWSRQLLKTLWQKEKLLIMSNNSFYQNSIIILSFLEPVHVLGRYFQICLL